MKYTLINNVCSFLNTINIPNIFRRLFFKNTITIFVYHNPTPKMFSEHIKWALQYYKIVSIDDAIDALRENCVELLGNFPLVITIDDGRKENYNLLPIIKEYKIKPIFYLCSAVVGTNRQLWDDYILLYNPSILKRLKYMSEKRRRDYLLKNFGYRYEDEFSTRTILSYKEIKEMSPYVDFGSHGRFHQPFSTLNDDELKSEAFLSKSEIESITNRPCKHFSYPSGMYDYRSYKILKEAGYISIRTTKVGINRNANDISFLKVTGASDHATLEKLSVQSCGIIRLIREILTK